MARVYGTWNTDYLYGNDWETNWDLRLWRA